MSFVGTRPEATKYVEKYSNEMLATLLLPAGITSEATLIFLKYIILNLTSGVLGIVAAYLGMGACEKVYSIFQDERYKAVLGESEPCQYMLLNIVWLMNNKQPMKRTWMRKISEQKRWQTALLQNFCCRVKF